MRDYAEMRRLYDQYRWELVTKGWRGRKGFYGHMDRRRGKQTRAGE